MDPFPFDEENDKELFQLDEESMRQIQEAYGEATIDFIDGYRQGFRVAMSIAFEEGLEAGWARGREDVLYQLRRYVRDSYDPEIEQLLKEITGED